jgi:hypothetical protein
MVTTDELIELERRLAAAGTDDAREAGGALWRAFELGEPLASGLTTAGQKRAVLSALGQMLQGFGAHARHPALFELLDELRGNGS